MKLEWGAVGNRGEAYPAWVRELKKRSGVYVIRLRKDRTVVYVGSSQTRLYDTLTRHFQVWRRFKGFWREAGFGEGNDPGLTYDRGNVEVAVLLTSAADAPHEEAKLICRLMPRDNVIFELCPEGVPF